MTLFASDASAALTSLICEYFGQMPLTSEPRTHVQECHCMAATCSALVTWRPAAKGRGHQTDNVKSCTRAEIESFAKLRATEKRTARSQTAVMSCISSIKTMSNECTRFHVSIPAQHGIKTHKLNYLIVFVLRYIRACVYQTIRLRHKSLKKNKRIMDQYYMMRITPAHVAVRADGRHRSWTWNDAPWIMTRSWR